MQEHLATDVEDWQDDDLEDASYSMMGSWKSRLCLELIGVSLITFSLAAILFRNGILSPDYLSIIDVLLFYVGFIVLVGIFLLGDKYYSVD